MQTRFKDWDHYSIIVAKYFNLNKSPSPDVVFWGYLCVNDIDDEFVNFDADKRLNNFHTKILSRSRFSHLRY